MKWFKHDTDANADNRLQNVLLDYGLEGYGLYWYCLELIASKVDKDSVTFELEHDARVIARNTGSTAQKIEEMMRYFVSIGLFENADGVITCLKMAKRLDKSMTSNQEMRKIIESMASNNTVLDGFVYFIEKRDSTGGVIAIKIGRSKNPSARLNELSKIDENVGFSLECIHKIKSENCVALETDLHRKFKHLNIYNEWFTPSESIYELINGNYVMTTSGDVMQEEIRLDQIRQEEIREETKDSMSKPAVCDDAPKSATDERVRHVIDLLNSLTGSKYRASTKSHSANISGRLNDGYSVDDLLDVVRFKCGEWLHVPKMAQYLRPGTLFQAGKFNGYLTAARAAQSPLAEMSAISRKNAQNLQGEW